MFTAIPIQFILYLYKAAIFQSPQGGRLTGVGLYYGFGSVQTVGCTTEICFTNDVINNCSIHALVETNQGIAVLYYK